jgi:hypothetical protein
MSIGKAITIWAALLIAGAGGSWAARARYDRKAMEDIAVRALMLEMSTAQPRTQTYVFRNEPYPPPTPEERDAELRCVVYDPEAFALPATVQKVIRRGDFTDRVYELQLATARGTFTIDWRRGTVPKAGRTGELLGRIADRGQFEGTLTRLEPGWFEPAGTIARVRHAKVR